MTDNDTKRQAAIAYLGDRYLCHPSNQVKRNPQKQPATSRVDVARTIKKARERMGELA